MKFISSISGFGAPGSPAVALACFHDPATDTLVILRDADPEEPIDREADYSLVSSGSQDDYDMLFTEDHLAEAVSTYFAMRGADTVIIEDVCQRHAPDQSVRPDGIDEKGIKYRFSDRMGNGAVAVLAACLYAKRNRGFRVAASFTEELAALTDEAAAGAEFFAVRSI